MSRRLWLYLLRISLFLAPWPQEGVGQAPVFFVAPGGFACRLDFCPRCGGHRTKFSCHGRRPRTFWPPSALRHKRYVWQTVLDMGIRYLTDRREQLRSRRTPEKP